MPQLKRSGNLEMLIVIRVDPLAVTESHSPSAIASDELSLAIGDEDIGHLDEAEKDSESSSDSGGNNSMWLYNIY